jgi:glutamine synthetase
MAGLDGIINRIDPIQAGYIPQDAPGDAGQNQDFLPRSLADALDALEQDHQFLIRDEVFPESLIRRWLEIKRSEINAINRMPHPYEFTMYFDF